MPASSTFHPTKKILWENGFDSEISRLKNQLLGKYTWLRIDSKQLFFKIITIAEAKKISDIEWLATPECDSRRCGTLKFQGGCLPVFDFRKKAEMGDGGETKSDQVIIIEGDYHSNRLFLGILFNEIDEIIY